MKPFWSPPEEFEEYRLLQALGQGEMGKVYVAFDTLLARHVAVKFVSAREPSAAALQRFLTEARAAARLQHPNVVAIHRVGELEGHPYLVSEFVHGQTLDRIPKPVPWTRALQIGIDLARGLACAHRKGVLHRDLKPANAILAEDGSAKLLDFGLAKLLEGGEGDEPSGLATAAIEGSGVDSPGTPPPPDLAEIGAGPSPTLVPESLDAPRSTLELLDPAAEIRASQRPAGIALSPARVVVRGNFVDPSATQPPPSPAAGAPEETLWPEAPAGPASGPEGAEPASPLERPGLATASSGSGSPRAAQLTKTGAVMGTPDYMAPEIWRGLPATRQADVYSLGALLFELCVGEPPYGSVAYQDLPRVAQQTDAPPLAQAGPATDPRFAAIVDRCLSRNPADRFPSGDAVREALENLARAASGDAIPEGNPYRGLRPFEAEHRALFFGRGTEIGVVLDRLRAEAFVVVAGESGVGKSSLARAGVLPRVAGGALEGGRTWSTLTIVPGKHPLVALAAVLAEHTATEERALLQTLREDPAAVAYALRRRLGQASGLLLLLDQLEELVTMADPDEAAAADEVLGRLAGGVPGVRLLATARADLLARLAALPFLGDEISRALYILRPLSPEAVREVIVGPAHATGVRFESEEVVDTLVEATAHANGGLPLLQFALAELWEARDVQRGIITAQGLESIGGVEGALSRHADSVVGSLVPAQRAAARRMLTRLVGLDATRAQRSEAELAGSDPAARAALDALVRGRLVVAQESEGESVYEVAHEALIQGWKALGTWLHEDADRRVVGERLAHAAAEWERLGHANEALWLEPQLAEVERVGRQGWSPRETAFLVASRRARRLARWRRRALVAAVPVAVLLVYGVLRLVSSLELDQKVEAHLREAGASVVAARVDNARAESLRRQAFAHFDAQERVEGERVWARALARGTQVERRYAEASQAIEAALALDPQRAQVRSLLGDVLYERGLLADRDRRIDRRDELVQRLELYDENGERLRRWHAVGIVRIETSPPGAQALLERYESHGVGRLRPEIVRDLGVTPLSAEVPPGSYRLRLTAPGRVQMRYPLLVARGEPVGITVELPQESRIPRGFVYIPPGRFLFGSSADEGLRRGFFDTVPLHEVRTRGYLIGRTEVTYAEWLEFLGDLPRAERARRTPSVAAKLSVGGALKLQPLARGRWRFTFQPAQQAYTALSGEPIRYPGRKMRAVQDWLKFPVTGISVADAEAYLAWLRREGRVPGARLCTEQEWERAARGADDREFPHGYQLDPDDANYDETYGKDPRGIGLDEVGSHFASRSPFEIDDMTGNAYEWAVSSLAPKEYVGRGGSFFYDQKTNRIPNRQVPTASLRDATLGLRVCASYPPR